MDECMNIKFSDLHALVVTHNTIAILCIKSVVGGDHSRRGGNPSNIRF